MSVTFATARKALLALPDVTEKPCYGTPGFYRKKKLFARQLPQGDGLVVKMSFEQRDAALLAKPKVFEVTPHYAPHPWCIVHLDAVSPPLLTDVLAEAHRLAALKR